MLIDPNEFLKVTQEPLEEGDVAHLADEVRSRWSVDQVCSLLRSTQTNARRVSALVVGLIGQQNNTHCLARVLHDRDPQVAEMAEHGMWSIWFRAIRPEYTLLFESGLTALSQEHYDQALDYFQRVIAADSCFVEAYNQAGIACYLKGEYQQSIEYCEHALRRCPEHFGAMAGMGHCYAELDQWQHALSCYQQALAINPTMAAIRSAVERLQEKVRQMEAVAEQARAN